jgi:hypothetical protein
VNRKPSAQNHARCSKPARAFFSTLETSGYQLKPKPIKPIAASPSASKPPISNSQIHRQKIGVGLPPNEKS